MHLKRTSLALIAAVIAALALSPAGAAAQSRASTAKQIRQLTKATRQLQAEVASLRGKNAALSAKQTVLERRIPSPFGPAGGALTGSYPNPQIAADAVGSGQIAQNAVGTRELANAAVTKFNLAPDVISASHLTLVDVERVAGAVTPGAARSIEAKCPANTRLLSGGFDWELHNEPADTILASAPSMMNPTTGWTVVGSIPQNTANTLSAIAYCLRG